MLNRMAIVALTYLPPEKNYNKPKMLTMNIRSFPIAINTTNNDVQSRTTHQFPPTRNVRDTVSGVSSISMREILGVPKKNCSSCRGG